MYKALSRDRSLLTLNLPIKVILLKGAAGLGVCIWGCFLMFRRRMLHFSEALYWKLIQIHHVQNNVASCRALHYGFKPIRIPARAWGLLQKLFPGISSWMIESLMVCCCILHHAYLSLDGSTWQQPDLWVITSVLQDDPYVVQYMRSTILHNCVTGCYTIYFDPPPLLGKWSSTTCPKPLDRILKYK